MSKKPQVDTVDEGFNPVIISPSESVNSGLAIKVKNDDESATILKKQSSIKTRKFSEYSLPSPKIGVNANIRINNKRKSIVHFATPETSVDVRKNMFSTVKVGQNGGKNSRNAFQFSTTNVKKSSAKGQELVSDSDEKIDVVAKEQLVEGEDLAVNSNTVESPNT